MSSSVVGQLVSAGSVIQWGILTITVANLAVILAMVIVFVLAILLPFPASDEEDGS